MQYHELPALLYGAVTQSLTAAVQTSSMDHAVALNAFASTMNQKTATMGSSRAFDTESRDAIINK